MHKLYRDNKQVAAYDQLHSVAGKFCDKNLEEMKREEKVAPRGRRGRVQFEAR